MEAILNSRPINKVSDEKEDLEALTPNHILLLKGKPGLPPGLFENKIYTKLLCIAGAPRSSWMMGKVLEAKQDAKGLVCTVHLKTKRSTLERPVTKVSLLLEATD